MGLQCLACGQAWASGHLCKPAFVLVTSSRAEAQAEFDAVVRWLGERQLPNWVRLPEARDET